MECEDSVLGPLHCCEYEECNYNVSKCDEEMNENEGGYPHLNMESDHEKCERYKQMSTEFLFDMAETRLKEVYHLQRDVIIIKNILLYRGENVGSLIPYDPYSQRTV
jgi:hypothetical protein